jgi:hypothetical protein
MQTLSLGEAFNTGSSILSTWMGNPTSLTLFMNSNSAATITVELSPDGATFYEYGTVVLAAGGSSIQTIPGAGFIQLSTSANITTFNSHVNVNS